MHAVERERKHLAEANRHIAAAKRQIERQIERQKRVVEKLAQAGHETDVAKSLLHAMERSLDAFEQHRELIVETMKTLEVARTVRLGVRDRASAGTVAETLD